MKNIIGPSSYGIFISLAINFLFVWKYASRTPDFLFPALAAYLLLAGFLYYFREIVNRLFDSYRRLLPTLLVLYILFGLMAWHYIDLQWLHVDRWSVITSFWDNAFAGKYPYMARSLAGNYPGPSPVYFILALPYYLIGEIGWMPLTGVFLFCWLIYRRMGSQSGVFILFLLCSPCIAWEVVTRSTVLFNVSMVLYALHLSEKRMKNLMVQGVLSGMVICIRGLAVLPLAVWWGSKIRSNHKATMFIYPLGGAIAGFVLPFLPLYIWDRDAFWHYNPLFLQSEHFLPFYLIFSFVAGAFISGLIIPHEKWIYTVSSLFLFLVFLVYLFNTVWEFGWYTAINESRADISYAIFAFGFGLIGCAETTQTDD